MKYFFNSNKTDRNRFTRMCIGESIVSLLHTKSLENIKVSHIVAKAGISRMTYYNYYHSTNEALSDYLQEIIKEYIAVSDNEKDIGDFHSATHVLHCLLFFDQYSDFILTLHNAGLYSIIINAVNDYMTKKIMPSSQYSTYELYYYAGALLNIFIKWEESGKSISAEEIAHIIISS